MAVPTLISDLNTVIASNVPAGSENVFPQLDDYIRALSAFIAQLSASKAGLASPAFTGTMTAVDVTTTGNTILGDAATDTLNVGAGGLVKDASGNIGIGMTPTYRVDATHTQNFGSAYRMTNINTGNAASAGLIGVNNGGKTMQAAITGSGYTDLALAGGNCGLLFADGAGGMVLYATSGTIRFAAGTGAEQHRMDGSGNFLIGTSTAGASALKTLQLGNATPPTGNIAGGQIYVESGVLKYRGSSGTVTVLGAA